MKTIWLMNQYAAPSSVAQDRYNMWAERLAAQGNRVIVFCASFRHGATRDLITDKSLWIEETENNVRYVYIRAHRYAGNGADRVRNFISFYYNLLKTVRQFDPPDLIIARSPNPMVCWAALKLKRRYGVPCICDIVDFWPESIVTYMNVPASNPLIRFLYRCERSGYRRADAVIFSMPGGWDYICEKGWQDVVAREKLFYVNMGEDLKTFDENLQKYHFDDPDLHREGTFKVIYLGSVRLVNNLKLLCDTAKVVQDRGLDDIAFLIYGGGDQVESLREYCAKNGIHNAKLYGSTPKQYMPDILSHADLTVLNYRNTPLLRFGGSMNKMFDYFSSSKPVLTNTHMGHSLIKEYRCGLEAEDTPESMADGVEFFYRMTPEERAVYGKNARRAAEDYSQDKMFALLLDCIDYAMNKSGRKDNE